MIASSAVYRGFEPRSDQTKDYKIDICYFSAKHTALRRKTKDWLAGNQNNVSEWTDMSTRRLLFQRPSSIKIILSVLAYNKADLIIISLKINLFSPWYSWKIAELALNTNHSLTHSRYQKFSIRSPSVFCMIVAIYWHDFLCVRFSKINVV